MTTRLDLICTSASGGRIYASSAPGKIDRPKGIYRDLETDLEALSRLGITVIICLIEDFEFEKLSITDYPARAIEQGCTFIHYPIPDHCTPDRLDSFHELIVDIYRFFNNGSRILVHCRGGVGRTGLVCAAVLLHYGFEADQSIAAVKSRRAKALRNQNQCQFVRHYDRLLLSPLSRLQVAQPHRAV